jgi:tetratricopeptide (TPR) repeat protein
MPQRTRLLLWWLCLIGFVGGLGGAVASSAIKDSHLVLGDGVLLVFGACIVVTAVAQYRDYARGRPAFAAWTWWQDQDPEVQHRQWQVIGQQFAQPYADALPALEQATQHTPSDADAWASLAYALDRVGRSEEALAASERALALDPQHASAWARKASALVNLKRMDDALVASERSQALDPEVASAWGSKGAALGQLGRYAEALDAYDHAVALGIETNSPWYRVNVELARCRLLCQLGRYAEGLEACDEVLAAQPDLALGWYSKAICLHHCGRTVEATAAVLRAKELAG